MSRFLRAALTTVMGLAVAAPPAVAPTTAVAKPSDGEPTPAACRALGFTVSDPQRTYGYGGVAPAVGMPA
ncbi:MAG: hypothetical protein EON88_06035, partial [Brevundimonas sp.]